VAPPGYRGGLLAVATFVPVSVTPESRRDLEIRIELPWRDGCQRGLAADGGGRMRGLAARAAEVSRVVTIRLTVQLDRRARSDTLLAQVVAVFGSVNAQLTQVQFDALALGLP
jgi:hypothetical protein